MTTARHRQYEFAPFRLDPVERRLTRNGAPVALTPKCFDLLVVLVENGGRLLEKSDLMAQVWPNQFVEEGNLSFNISELRRALGEGENGSQYIETVRKKGFRFVAPVQDLPVADDRNLPLGARPSLPLKIVLASVAVAAVAFGAYVLRRPPTVAPFEGPPRTLAVLPFKPLAANVRDEALEIGICNALIAKLARLDRLVVRPTSSVAMYNKMGHDPLAAGRDLHVDALVDGYIERSQDRIRVTARLIRIADGKSLWSGEFDEHFTDIFAVEDSISQKIVEALHLNLTADEQRRVTKHPTENADAYELYLKGRYFQDQRTGEGLARSIEDFQQATEKDPRFAQAFAALSQSYSILAIRADAPPRIAYEKARAAALHALDIDEATVEAHVALATVKSWYDWDWPGAEREFKRAIALSGSDRTPTQQYASYLLAVGRRDEAIAEIKRAQRYAPLSLTTNVQAARILYFAGQYDDAMEQCRKTIDLAPDFGGAYLFVGRIDTQRGSYDDALTALARARTLLRDSAEVMSLIGYTYAVSGRTAEARQMLETMRRLSKQRYISPYHFAMIHAGLGERDEAFTELEKAYADREGRMTILKLAPEFATLRSDPRFTSLLQRMKLT